MNVSRSLAGRLGVGQGHGSGGGSGGGGWHWQQESAGNRATSGMSQFHR